MTVCVYDLTVELFKHCQSRRLNNGDKTRNKVKGENPFRLKTGSFPSLLTLSLIAEWLRSCQCKAFWYQHIPVWAVTVVLLYFLTSMVHPLFHCCSLQTNTRLPAPLLALCRSRQGRQGVMEQAGTQGGISGVLSSWLIKSRLQSYHSTEVILKHILRLWD